LTGCATKREAQEVFRVVEVHDTLRQDVFHVDSVFVRDSVRVWLQGDTIHETRWRVEYRDRWRDRVQEVIRVQTDTLIKENVVTIERKPTIMQRVKPFAAGLLAGVFSLSLFIIVHKRKG
jgi:hypothetical protein